MSPRTWSEGRFPGRFALPIKSHIVCELRFNNLGRKLSWVATFFEGSRKQRLKYKILAKFQWQDFLRQNCRRRIETLRWGGAVNAVLYAFDSKVLPQVTETVEVAERARTLLMGIHKRIVGDPAKISPRFSGKSESGSPFRGHGHAFFLPQDRDGDGRLDHLLVRCAQPFDECELHALDGLGTIWQRDGRPELACTPIEWGAPQGVLSSAQLRLSLLVIGVHPADLLECGLARK
jgi:hypothetical protein